MKAPSKVFDGGDSGDDSSYADDEEDMPDEGNDDDVPPDFKSAYDEWDADPSASTMYRMIEACKGGSGGGLLALAIGPKAKKK